MEKNEIEIFSIPIYSCTPTAFKKRFDKYIFQYSKDMIQAAKDTGLSSEEEIIDKNRRINYKEGIWIYNQIVGYIRIYLWELSFWFDLYIPDLNERRYIFSKKKKYVSLHQLGGLHFSLSQDNESNRKQMVECLKSVKDYLPNKLYIHLDQFNALNGIIDYAELIRKSKK